MATIGSRIKSLRKTNNLTQTDFGKLFGVGKTTISSYETGNSTPNDDIKKEICNYFNISMDYLLGLTDSTHTKTINFTGFIFDFDNSPELSSLINKIQSVSLDVLEQETNISKERLKSIVFKELLPSPSDLTRIASFFGCSIEQLFGCEKNCNTDLFSQHEVALIKSYRNHPEMQLSVDKLLGIETGEKLHIIKKAARNGDNSPLVVTDSKLKELENLPEVPLEDG